MMKVFDKPQANIGDQITESSDCISDYGHRCKPVVVFEFLHDNILKNLDHLCSCPNQMIWDIRSASDWGQRDVEINLMLKIVWHQRGSKEHLSRSL